MSVLGRMLLRARNYLTISTLGFGPVALMKAGDSKISPTSQCFQRASLCQRYAKLGCACMLLSLSTP